MNEISAQAREFAQTLVQRFQDASAIDSGDGTLMHAVLSEGAVDQYFNSNTGGFIWLSHTLHRAPDGTVLHLQAGWDSCGVYRAVADTAEKCDEQVYEMCGETDDILAAEGDYTFPDDAEDPEVKLAALTELYQRFLDRNGLPAICCMELQVGHDLTPAQRAWAEAFSTKWDECEQLPNR